jgi:hypothetical protein
MPRADYEERKAARIDRLHSRAVKAGSESEAAYKASSKMASVIPFGQPILVGHHSEKRDRNYRAKIHRKMAASVDLAEKSKRLAARASAAEDNRAVSSDDPEAVRLLKERLAAEKEIHEENKAANRKLRKAKIASYEASLEGLKELVGPRIAAELWSMIKIGHLYGRYVALPSYELSNRRANIKRIEGRIAELIAAESEEYEEVERAGFKIVHNPDVNRVQLVFPGKPSAAVRSELKAGGFRWSSSEGAWQRLLNGSGKSAAKYVASRIEN